MDEFNPEEIAYELLPVIRVYKDGRVERFHGTDTIPPGFDPQTGVTSKDVVILPEINVSARLYLPTLTNPEQKLPLVVYFHGGRFCIGSAFSPMSHHSCNSLASKSNLVIVSVDYRLAPEHPLPTAYQDSWAALKWVGSHCSGQGPDLWLANHVDFGQLYLGGDSAGANIAHNMAMQVGRENGVGLRLIGVALVHPYFWGVDPIGAEKDDLRKKEDVNRLWPFVCPSAPTNDDLRVNPIADGAPCLSGMGCAKVLVCVAGIDIFRDRGWAYYEALNKSGWQGSAAIFETEGEDHIFHLRNPNSDKVVELMDKLAFFFK